MVSYENNSLWDIQKDSLATIKKEKTVGRIGMKDRSPIWTLRFGIVKSK